MPTKLYDLAVKTRTYTTSSGEQKAAWMNVGAAFKGEDGGMYIQLSRAFNPAGVPHKEGGDSILVSCFEPKGREEAQPEPKPAPRKAKPAMDDDIPFANPYSGRRSYAE